MVGGTWRVSGIAKSGMDVYRGVCLTTTHYTFVLWDFKGCIIFNHEGLSVGLLYWAAHTLQDHRTSFRGRAAKTTAQNQA